MRNTLISVIIIFLVETSGVRFDHDITDEPSLDDLAESSGYSLQRYEIVVSDGYILTMLRIKQENASNLKPILFIHGLTGCPDTMFITRNYSAPIFFARHNFDVWLLGNRGTFESLGHVKWNSSIDREYWEFSLHEIGMVDIPGAIDMVLSMNKHEKVAIIGHSAGSTSIFVTLAELPEYNAKVVVSFHWGSSIYHVGCAKIFKFFCINRKLIINLWKSMGFINAVASTYLKDLVAQACRMDIMGDICEKFYTFIYKLDTAEHKFPYLFSKSWCGGSFEEFDHIAQIGETELFAKFDFGLEKNLQVYNASKPPLYPLEKVTSPVVIWCGMEDTFCSPDNMKRANDELPNATVALFPKFGHLDFVVSKKAAKVVFSRALKVLAKYMT